MTKTKTKNNNMTKNITVHSDEIITVHSDDLYKMGKALESLYNMTDDLNNHVSDGCITASQIEKALDEIDVQIDKAFTIIKTVLIENDIVSGQSYPKTLPKKV